MAETEDILAQRKASFIRRWQFVVTGNAIAGANAYKIWEGSDYTEEETKALTQGYRPMKGTEFPRNQGLEQRARVNLFGAEELGGDGSARRAAGSRLVPA